MLLLVCFGMSTLTFAQNSDLKLVKKNGFLLPGWRNK